MARQSLLTALPYTTAAMAAPVVCYVLQPHSCLKHLFLPYLLPVIVILCLAAAAAQSLLSWRPVLQVVAGALFALSIQTLFVVPCVSGLEDSSRVLRLVVLSLYSIPVAAAVLGANSAGLLRPGPVRPARAFAAVGFAIAGLSLAISSAREYLAMIGAVPTEPFVALAEARTPTSLMVGVGIAVVGTAASHLQLARVRARGGVS